MDKKKNLGVAMVVVIAAVCLFLFLGGDLEHIKDTNGADNYALTTITDQQIIDCSMGALNIAAKTGKLNGMAEISSDKFTGVYEIFNTNYIGSSAFVLQLYGFTVTEGNFKMCVIVNDEIVEVIEPNDYVECHLEDISGRVRLVIAGESAAFRFEMTGDEYDALVNG